MALPRNDLIRFIEDADRTSEEEFLSLFESSQPEQPVTQQAGPNIEPSLLAARNAATDSNNAAAFNPDFFSASAMEDYFAKNPINIDENSFRNTSGGFDLNGNLKLNSLEEQKKLSDLDAIYDPLVKQILGQNLTKQWTGQGFGSPEANARSMAEFMASAGIRDIKDFGKVTKYEPALVIGQTFNGRSVQNPSPGVYYQQIPEYDSENGTTYRRQDLTPQEAELVKTVYGKIDGSDSDGNPVYSAIPESSVVMRDGVPMFADGTTLGNKATGQPIKNTFSAQGGANVFGGTTEGSGNTGYRVHFGDDGTPYFFTTYATSNDFAKLLNDLGPIGQIAIAVATAGMSIPAQIATQAGIQLLAGADPSDIAKNVAVSMIVSNIPGSDFMKETTKTIKDMGLDASVTKVLTNSVQTAASSAVRAAVTGQSIGDAVLAGAATGGINGAINVMMDTPDIKELTKDLSATQKRMVETAISGVISGKPLDQAIINAAIAGASAEAREQAKYKPLTETQLADLTPEEKAAYDDKGPRGLKLYQDEVKATNRAVKNLSSLTDTGRTGDDMGGSYDTSAGGESTVTGAAGNDSATSGAGTDTVTAGSGSDPLINNLINAGLTQETDNTVNLPSGTQLAAANTGTTSDAGGGTQVNISGYPRYAEHADVKTLTPPPGYTFVSVADADNKPEGAYLDYSLNKNGVWVAPTGFTDVDKVVNNADADLFNLTAGTLGTGQTNETAAGLGVNAEQTGEDTATTDDDVVSTLTNAGLTQNAAANALLTEAELEDIAFNKLGLDKDSPAMAEYVVKSRNMTSGEVNSQIDNILQNWHNKILTSSGQDLSNAELRDKILDATSVAKNATNGTQDPASVTSALVSILNDSKAATSTTSGASTASGNTGASAETSGAGNNAATSESSTVTGGAANTDATSGSGTNTSTGGSESDTVVNDLTNAGLTQNTDTQQVSNIATGSSNSAAARIPTADEIKDIVFTKLGIDKDSPAMANFINSTSRMSLEELDSQIDSLRDRFRERMIASGVSDVSDDILRNKILDATSVEKNAASGLKDPANLGVAYNRIISNSSASTSTPSGGSASSEGSGSSAVTGSAGSDAIVNDLSSAGLTQSSGSQQASDIINSSGNTSTETAASGTQQTATDSSSAANTNTASQAALNLPVTADGIRTAAFDKLGLDKDSPAMAEFVVKAKNFTQGELDGFLDTQLQNLRNRIVANGGQDLSNAELRNKIFDATSVAKNANNPAGNPQSVAAAYNQVLSQSKGSTAATTGAQQVSDSATGSSGSAAGTESNTAATGGDASQQTSAGSSGAATGSNSVIDNLIDAGLTQGTESQQVSTIMGGAGSDVINASSNTAAAGSSSNTAATVPFTEAALRDAAFDKLGLNKDGPAMAELLIKSRNFTQSEFNDFTDTLLQNWRNKILAKGGPELSNAELRNQILGVTSGAQNAGSDSTNSQTVASAFNTVLNNNTAAKTTTSGGSTSSGATGSNSVVGGSGIDTLTGGSGASQTGTNTTTDGIDTVIVGSGGSSGSSADSTTGDTDTDNVIVSTGRDTAQGGTNNSTVIGGTGNTATTGGGGNNVVITGAATTCPVGTTLNTLTGECEPVQVATTGTQGAGASTNTGGTDTVVVTGNNETCPAGTTLNTLTGECDAVVTSAGGTKTNTNTLTCPAGMVPNEAGTQCIPQTIIVGNRETCPAGTTLNTLTGNCDPVQTTVTGGTGTDTLPGGTGGDTTPGSSGDDWRINFDPVKALDEFYNPFTYQSPKTPSQTDTGPIQLMTDIFGTDISKANKTGARGYELDLAKGGDIDELLRILRSKV